MILCKHLKFLFLKGKKVAGTSIEVALSPLCDPDDIITPITPIDEKLRVEAGRHAQNYGADDAEHKAFISSLRARPIEELGTLKRPIGIFNNHMPYRDILERYDGDLRGFTVFGVARCPYRKLISWANMSLGLKRYKSTGALTVDPDDVTRLIRRSIEDRSLHSLDNSQIYKAATGAPKVHILRFENIEHDFARLQKLLGIEQPLRLPHLKKGGAGVEMPVGAYLGAEEIAVVNEIFSDEFAFFGYSKIEQ